MINQHSYLKEIYLHWNKLTGKSSGRIFDTLAYDNKIRVFDLSWNDLGFKLNTEAISNFFKLNSAMRHIDFSYNKIGFSDTQKLSDALNYNQTIYGIHFSGNCGQVKILRQVDQKGFLKVKERIFDSEIPIIYRIKGQEPTKLKKNWNWHDIPNHEFCWICDGWSQFNFEWPDDEQPIYLHLEFENFEGKFIGNKNNQNRVVPSQQIRYFFSFNEFVIIDQVKPNIVSELDTIMKFKILNKNLETAVNSFNQKQTEYNGYLFYESYILNENYDPLITVKPRELDLIWIPPVIDQENQITPLWNLRDSIFKDWHYLTQNKKNLCFIKDWEKTKINKFLKDPIDFQNVRKFFKQNFDRYLNCYKYYSCFQPINDIWCIQLNPMIQFLNKVKVIDKNLTLDDIMVKWANTLSQQAIQSNDRTPERGLVRYFQNLRHQFIEFLTRIADQKYIKTKICSTYLEALTRLFDEHLNLEFDKRDKNGANIWREQVYWNSRCDKVLKTYEQILISVFKIFSTHNKIAGMPFIKLSEFQV